MLSATFKQDRAYLERKFKQQVCDPDSGLDNETLKSGVMALAEALGDLPHPVVKAKAFEYVARHVRIDVSPHDWFVAFGCWDRYDRPLNPLLVKWDKEVDDTLLTSLQTTQDQNDAGASIMWKDFDHSVPDWEVVFELGFPGLLERARRYRREREERGEMSDEARAYFDGIEITYGAILEMLDRFHGCALEHAADHERLPAVAACLDNLRQGTPTDTYEALQLIYLFFMFGEHIDRFQVRSLSNLDRMLQPFFQRDVTEKRYTTDQIREFLAYFLMQWASIDNYWGHPFYLGGTMPTGQCVVNDLSYLILDVFDELCIPTPKIQIKISPGTPVEFIDKALDMIRRGNSSLVFVSEASVKRALMHAGVPEQDACDCDITGCYEFIPRGRGNSTAAGYVNMLKPFELIFHNGVDPRTGIACGCQTGDLAEIHSFDEFYAAYLQQLDHVVETIIRCVNDFEQHLSRISPAQVFSATIENSLKTARDAFQDGSVYNLSLILEAGFATAVDALMIIKDVVFEKQELTLGEFRDILDADWHDHDKLRLKMLRHKHKFGNGIERVDALAENLARHLAETINRRPNARGGFYMASMHSARMFVVMGEKTGATPDGRKAGEEMSKNISPTMGMDTNGVTALVKSVTRIDSALFPGDFPLDVMMHPATVSGEDGLAAMRRLIEVYMKNHGVAIHFNIFDAKVLIEAQKHPEKYEGLQVRVCGWNVRFSDIAKAEQDAYIKRALSISE